MRNSRFILVAVLCIAASFCFQPQCIGTDIDAVLPLPQWPPNTSQNMPPLGGILLPEGTIGDDDLDPSSRPTQQPPSIATQLESSRTTSDLSLFLPEALLGKAIRPHQQSSPSTVQSLREIDGEFLAACREAGGDEHLIDPDSHVSETQREDLLRFLGFHARDARIKAYVVVLDRDQIMPANTDLSGVASGALSARDACLAVYPLGEPSRARLFVSDSVRKVATPDYLTSVVEDCAKDANQVTDPLEQLHRFTVRLSIRLFWLERLIGANKPALTRSNAEEIPRDVIAKREAAMTSVLDERDAPSGQSSLQWSSVVLGMMLSLAGGAATYAALRYRRKRLLGYVWILPEIDVPPRLGGVFSGGGGFSIQYR